MKVGTSRLLRTLLIICGVASLVAGADLFITTWTNRGVPAQTITVCRATDLPAHPYQPINVSIASDGSLPQDVDPARDIVPPYSYRGTNYAGANWSAQGQALWYAGCQPANSSLAVAFSPPPVSAVAVAREHASPLFLGLWPQAAAMQAATRAMAAFVMLLGLLMAGAGARSRAPAPDRPVVRVSSDLSTYRRVRIRPRRSRQ